jgi:hypothetical protein
MNQLDQVSRSIGRLQGEVANLQKDVKSLQKSIESLLQFKWKFAGVMIFAGTVVEGLHIGLKP